MSNPYAIPADVRSALVAACAEVVESEWPKSVEARFYGSGDQLQAIQFKQPDGKDYELLGEYVYDEAGADEDTQEMWEAFESVMAGIPYEIWEKLDAVEAALVFRPAGDVPELVWGVKVWGQEFPTE